MKEEELIQKIARLESMNDQLASELQFIDDVARKIGFINGISTLKSAAMELLEEQQNNLDNDNDENY